MNTNETAGVKPATDEQIFARMKELSARATEIVGVQCGVSACITAATRAPYWLVQEYKNYTSSSDASFERACANITRAFKEAQHRAAIEARVRAEMEASA